MNLPYIIIGIAFGVTVPISFIAGWAIGLWAGKEAIKEIRKDVQSGKFNK